ncbi:hypothetical protein J2S43_007936 [Catenuloplanes nepalensis]|uniref:Uncharacterized protein n=1 Tax=Catenuloplanes nepalensis TaxID=587533 RepID=A0ABT9N6V1_9ACTN|nr:hypothetical protein [Catenuloplanes nepalensis]
MDGPAVLYPSEGHTGKTEGCGGARTFRTDGRHGPAMTNVRPAATVGELPARPAREDAAGRAPPDDPLLAGD